MSLQAVLDQVPFLAHVGVQVEDYKPGRVVLSLRAAPTVENHVGTMQIGALATLAEAAGSAACATHPDLAGLRMRARGLELRFRRTARPGTTAHAQVTDEMAQAVCHGIGAAGRHDLAVPVDLLDGEGEAVARMIATYSFRRGG